MNRKDRTRIKSFTDTTIHLQSKHEFMAMIAKSATHLLKHYSRKKTSFSNKDYSKWIKRFIKNEIWGVHFKKELSFLKMNLMSYERNSTIKELIKHLNKHEYLSMSSN